MLTEATAVDALPGYGKSTYVAENVISTDVILSKTSENVKGYRYKLSQSKNITIMSVEKSLTYENK